MKRALSISLLPFFFFFSGCLDEVIDLSFQYEFDSQFALPEMGSGEVLTITSEPFDLGLIDEMETRRLAKLTAASLASLRMELSEAQAENWRFAESIVVKMHLDGTAYPLAELSEIPADAHHILELTPTAEEFKLMEFLDHETVQLELIIQSRAPLPAGLTVQVATALRLQAQPAK